MSDKPGKKPEAWTADEAIVSHAYDELEKSVPPAHLDETILARARRATADPNNVVVEVRRWRKWTAPVALAATVVVAVPLVVRVFGPAQQMIEAERSAAFTETARTAAEAGFADDSDPAAAIPGPESPEAAGHDTRLAVPPAAPVRPSVPRQTPPREPVDVVLPAEPVPQTFAAQEQKAVSPESDGRWQSDDSDTIPASSGAAADFAAAPPKARAEDVPEYLETGPSERVALQKTESVAETVRSTDTTAARYEAESAASENRRARPAPGIAASRTLAAVRADAEGDAAIALTDTAASPQHWLDEIAGLYRQGQIDTARRELGTFLTVYPAYGLPDGYPLQADDALFDDVAPGSGRIVPEAASWLRGIGLMAERGEIDQARTQLARFFSVYPDYPLPAGFPLTRADALPIER